MIRFNADWFDGRTSRAHRVTVVVMDQTLTVMQQKTTLCTCAMEGVEIVAALGSTRRTLKLPDGGRLDTLDAQGAGAVAQLESDAGHNPGLRFVHFLERRWKWAVISTLAMMIFIWTGAEYGLPWVAEKAAFALPEWAMHELGEGALESLDRGLFEPSELDSWHRDHLRAKYEDFSEKTGTAGHHQLVFRSFHYGPNAFALPSGVIVMTDQMVEFAESDGELIGIIAHEIAHLERRHALRRVIQSSGVFLAMSLLTGDVTSFASLAGTLPTVLVESRYSRKYEMEADEIGARYLQQAGLPVEPMARFMERMGELHGNGIELLSSHPDSEKRAERFQEAAEEGKEGSAEEK